MILVHRMEGESFAEITVANDSKFVKRVMLALDTNGSIHYLDIDIPVKKITLQGTHYVIFNSAKGDNEYFFNIFDAISRATILQIEAIERVTVPQSYNAWVQ